MAVLFESRAAADFRAGALRPRKRCRVMFALTPKLPQAGSGQQLMSKSPTGAGRTCGKLRLGTLLTFGIPFTERVKLPADVGRGAWPFREGTKRGVSINARVLPVGFPTAAARD
jgi:hypothetical protein